MRTVGLIFTSGHNSNLFYIITHVSRKSNVVQMTQIRLHDNDTPRTLSRYSFIRSRQRGSVVYWRCTTRNKAMTCYATVRQREDTFEAGHAPHSHPAHEGCLGLAELVVQVNTPCRIFHQGNCNVNNRQVKLMCLVIGQSCK